MKDRNSFSQALCHKELYVYDNQPLELYPEANKRSGSWNHSIPMTPYAAAFWTSYSFWVSSSATHVEHLAIVCMKDDQPMSDRMAKVQEEECDFGAQDESPP